MCPYPKFTVQGYSFAWLTLTHLYEKAIFSPMAFFTIWTVFVFFCRRRGIAGYGLLMVRPNSFPDYEYRTKVQFHRYPGLPMTGKEPLDGNGTTICVDMKSRWSYFPRDGGGGGGGGVETEVHENSRFFHLINENALLDARRERIYEAFSSRQHWFENFPAT